MIIIIKATSSIAVQRANIPAGIIAPARLHASHREESCSLLLCILCIQDEGRKKPTTELLSLKRRSNVKGSPSLE